MSITYDLLLHDTLNTADKEPQTQESDDSAVFRMLAQDKIPNPLNKTTKTGPPHFLLLYSNRAIYRLLQLEIHKENTSC